MTALTPIGKQVSLQVQGASRIQKVISKLRNYNFETKTQILTAINERARISLCFESGGRGFDEPTVFTKSGLTYSKCSQGTFSLLIDTMS